MRPSNGLSLNCRKAKPQSAHKEETTNFFGRPKTFLPLQNFTIKSSDRATLLSRLTSVYKSNKARKARRWIGKCTRGLAARLSIAAPIKTTATKSALLKGPDFPPTKQLRILRNNRSVLKFTANEDEFLEKDINRYGYGQWTAILRDSDCKF